MDTTSLLVVILVLVIVGAGLAVAFSGRNHTKALQDRFGPEYERTVQTLGDEKKARKELEERQKHVEELDIRPLSEDEREHYRAAWAAVQSKFVDEPGQAVVDADRLIKEVMHLRAYPVADFEQRAAYISVNYPELVSNYRAAQAIALKNEHREANTEEMRQAMIDYRSLFNELLELEAVEKEMQR